VLGLAKPHVDYQAARKKSVVPACNVRSYLPFTRIRCANADIGREPFQMAKDPTRMSLKELQELELTVKKAKLNVQQRSRTELRQKLEAMAAQAGFKLSDLFGGRGGKGRKVAAKYANPDNPSETWSGRGRKPRWLAARLKAGDRIDKFLIK
jgi:DNA-binding protein H-NS